MGQEISCPCHNNDSNVLVSTDEDGEEIVVVAHKVPSSPTHTALNTASSSQSSNPFEKSRQGTPVGKVKSRKWDAQPKDGTAANLESSTRSTQEQDPGETAIGDSESHTSRDDLEYSLGNVKGEIAFPGDKAPGSRAAPERSTPSSRPATPKSRPLTPTSRPPDVAVLAESEATVAARVKQEAHNDRIVATFNSVMLADGLKVLKHHRRSSKRAASRVIRYVPDYGGALVWDKPLRQPGAKASRVPLDAISQVELEQRIVWISAGDERVGFETSKTEDADLMYQAICILVDRCHT